MYQPERPPSILSSTKQENASKHSKSDRTGSIIRANGRSESEVAMVV